MKYTTLLVVLFCICLLIEESSAWRRWRRRGRRRRSSWGRRWGRRTVRVGVVGRNLYGCYVDQWSRTLNGGRTVSNRMTVEKCAERCRRENRKFYGLEVGEECFVGDHLTRSNKKSTSECKKPCKGNKAQACGNNWRVLIYRNPSYKEIKVKPHNLLGCYVDQWRRTLNGRKTVSNRMTVEKCAERCRRENRKFYGLEVGEECFVGDHLTRSNKRGTGECKKPCKGNKGQACGNNWRVLIYRNPSYRPIRLERSNFVGCYKDHWKRTLGGKLKRSSRMTVSTCAAICAGSHIKFFGVENGNECFCGTKLRTNVKRPDKECLKRCSGKHHEGCGGPWRIAVYRNKYYKPTTIVRSNFVGCYKDHWKRTLGGKLKRSSRMTVSTCAAICAGSHIKFFGVENGNECFCGTKLRTNVKRPDKECLKRCSGKHHEGCGGPWRIAVYRNKYYKPTTIVRSNFVGCYKDHWKRTLGGKLKRSSRMTVSTCAAICAGSHIKFFGVENGNECFCGTKLRTNVKRPDKECLKRCSGKHHEGCGGPWRIAVYRNKYYKPTTIVRSNFVGCYKDQRKRTLGGKMKKSKRMTVKICENFCMKRNKKFFGVENRIECFCGNSLRKKVKMAEKDCREPCGGNRLLGCGGPWRIAIYRNKKHKPTTIVRSNFVACYKDQWKRTLGGKMKRSKDMTVKKCKEYCIKRNTKLFGVENGNECFCGDYLRKKVKKPESECLKSCHGHALQGCGGPWRIAVYKNTEYEPTTIVRKNFIGCYEDQRKRILGGKMKRSKGMTVETCKGFCTPKKSNLFGVQNGNECFCGKSIRKKVKKPKSECMKSCLGNRKQACGGTWRIAIYRIIPTSIVKTNYVGCFQENSGSKRILSGKKTNSKKMTVEKCSHICAKLKSKYYGLKAGSDCVCGNAFTKKAKKPDSHCLKDPCNGNEHQGCGGNKRVAVYKIPEKKPFVCNETNTTISCVSASGARVGCLVNGAEIVKHVGEPLSYNSHCVFGETYGRQGDEIWVKGKCGGKFPVCFEEVVNITSPKGCANVPDGSDYAGTWNFTESGRVCQDWASQTPHEHGHISLPNNYCRNPDGEPHAWCYTMDKSKRWEICGIPQCNPPKPRPVKECLTTAKGEDYNGMTSKTKSGYTCQNWNSQKPHSHKFGNLLGKNQKNYCRNPDGEPAPWCYTTNKDKRWDVCDIPQCAACSIEQEQGANCKVIYKISGKCHYESHYLNQCKYSIKMNKKNGKAEAEIDFKSKIYKVIPGSPLNKCAEFKMVDTTLVIVDKICAEKCPPQKIVN